MPITHDPLALPGAGVHVGRYRLLQVLGEGGMGIVYEAEELEPVRRRVALKILRDRDASSEIVARFEVERQALAVMSHPGIAKVFGAGRTDDGRPYFVMELVRGLPITAYCDEHRLSVRKRLELFCAVCHAVQHAHQKGLIHRDLKPSNILVSDVDGRAQPKVIDFGVAKATGQQLTEHTLVTLAGQAVGTAAYMSPEQADASGVDVDTRSDVYSLGVVLYEVLVARLPVDPSQVGFHVFLARLLARDTLPPLPSSRLAPPLDSNSVAEARRTDVTHLRRELRGDLDWIVMRAMEPDRARRYATANALAMDIQRYLQNEPVAARPPSATYRLQKFIRRHRATSVAAVLAVLAILTGSVFTTIGMVRAQRAERKAAEEAAAARQVTNFLVDIFRISNPGEARGNAVTARELLDRGAQRVERDLAAQPLLRSRLQHTIGTVYASLGLYAPAQSQFEAALQGRIRAAGPGDTIVAQTLLELGRVALDRGDFEDAERHMARALRIRESVQGPGHADVGNVAAGMALLRMRQGRLAEAESLYTRALRIEQAQRTPDDQRLARLLLGIGNVKWSQQRYQEAEPLFERALAIQERSFGPDHPEVASTLNSLGALQYMLGDFGRALPLYQRSLAIFEAVLPPDHPMIASSINNLAEVHWKLGRADQAEALFRRALASKERTLRATHPSLAETLSGLAGVLADGRRYSEAEPLLRRALAIRESAFGKDNASTAASREQLAALLRATGRGTEALVPTSPAPR